MSSAGLDRARAKMSKAGLDPVAIDTFAHYYRLLENGETGMIPESSIEPLDVESLSDADVDPEAASAALGTTAVIKLNGGLGTSMGMERAKSLLCVRKGWAFLDIIARQVLHLRREIGAREQAEEVGLAFHRIASLNADPGLIDALEAVARRSLLAVAT
jgi:UTP--glucose-1-phosphate uridylyltransferase